MRPISQFASMLALFSFTSLNCQELHPADVLVYYGKTNPDKIRGYKYVILESEQFSALDMRLIKESNETVVGYISLGEVSANRSYYAQLKDRVLGKNELWDSYYIDPADSVTAAILMQLVDDIAAKGFDGLFLDTVDAFGPWGPSKELADNLTSFLAKVKAKYPDFHLMQNSGIALLPKTHSYVSSLALESVATDYNFKQEQYRMRKATGFQERVEELSEAVQLYELPVVLIEYAQSKKLIERVKKKVVPLNWHYFIGGIELDQLPKNK